MNSHFRGVVLKLVLLTLSIQAPVTGVFAQEPLSTFLPGSYQGILHRYQGQPLLMVFWSLDCTHCYKELAMLGKMKERYPAINLVLVSTDSPSDSAELSGVIKHSGVSDAETWVFAKANSSQLRAEVDRVWYGELPRSYFFDVLQNRRAVSGALDGEAVEVWIRENTQGSKS